jgi:predicted PurR-regulated permease PerM
VERPSEDHDAAGRGWRPPGWRSGWAVPLAAGIGGGLLLAQVVTAVYVEIRGLLLIVVVSLFLSFALEPAVQWQARRGIRRGIGTGVVFLVSLLLLGGFVFAMTTLVVDQVTTLLSSGPALLDGLADVAARTLPGELGDQVAGWFDEQQQTLPARAPDMAGAVGRGALGVGQTVLGMLFQLATIGLVTFYLVADGPRIRHRLASRLRPEQQVRVLAIWELAIAKTGGYVYTRALTAVASSLFHVAVFSVIGLDYAVALGVWVGIISSLIPAIGTYLAGALPIVVALATSPVEALWVLAAIVLYQQVENYLIVPKITATTLELHPAVAFLSVLAGGALAGATGALLAIPAVAIATALLGAAAAEYDVLEHHLTRTGATEAVELMEGLDHPLEPHRGDPHHGEPHHGEPHHGEPDGGEADPPGPRDHAGTVDS